MACSLQGKERFVKKKESLAFGKPRRRNNRNTVTKYVKYDDVECLQQKQLALNQSRSASNK
ncbi:hypothetical protein ACE6H2_011931 [Prunus campanulata]